MSILMHHKSLLFSLLAVVLLLSGATITGILFAQGEDYSEVISVSPNDPEIVAEVDGLEATRRDLRLVPDFLRRSDPSISEADAVAQSIVGQIDDFIIQAEVESRGLMPTLAEADEFMKPNQEACAGPNGVDCREHLRLMGLDFNEYWANILPEYQQDLGKSRLMQVLVREKLLPGELGGTHEQALQARIEILAELREKANIVWHDKGLEQQYRQAVIALGSN